MHKLHTLFEMAQKLLICRSKTSEVVIAKEICLQK